MRSRGGEPEYPGQPTLNPQPSTLNLCPSPQPSTLRGRITKFSAHPLGSQALAEPTLAELLVVIAIIGILLNLPPAIPQIICSVLKAADIYQ
jgi:prepilin-type N-terminal cleavage/methylation domain-containing protein